MTEENAIEVIYDGDCRKYAEHMWDTMRKRAQESGDVQVADEYSRSDTWQRFGWKQFSEAAVRSFQNDRDHVAKPAPDVPHVEIRYDPEPIREALDSHDEPTLAAAANDLLELAEAAYSGGPEEPNFVYGVSSTHRDRLVNDEVPPPVTAESLAEDRIEYACWLMGFPPSVVDTYGRDRLLSVPAWQKSELPDGGVVILATENPTNLCKPETRAIDQHLGLDPPPETTECDY